MSENRLLTLRWLVLTAAIALAISVSTGGAAQAGVAPRGVMYAVRQDPAKAPSAPVTADCAFKGVRTCESVSPKASTYVKDVGDTTTCTFQWKINWGDGSKVQTIVSVDPPANTYVLLASHTFPYQATYRISLTGTVLSGGCYVKNGQDNFTFLSYVALGDSYSSGTGAGAYLKGTGFFGNRCYRSPRAYAELADKYLGNNPDYSFDPFVFEPCNGATIDNFVTPQEQGVPAQLFYLESGKGWVGLVTLTIGGNDLHFAEIMNYCARRSAKDQSCQNKYEKTVDDALATIEVRLFNLYLTIRREPSLARTARVLVLGYPRFFPNGQKQACSTGYLNSVFEPSDMKWINDSIQRLDTYISRAAKAAGITYVNTYDVLVGHELCQPDPWLHGVYLSSALAAGSFHPTTDGQNAMAKAAEAAMPR